MTGSEDGTSHHDASYVVRFWPLFLGVFLTSALAMVFLGIGLGALVGTFWAPGRWVVGVLVTLVIGWEGYHALVRLVYRVRLHDGVLLTRSTLVQRELPVQELTAVAWGQRNQSYRLYRLQGRPLILWAGKGSYDFLRVLGQERPDLQIDESLRSRKLEKDIGRSGFSSG